MKLKRFLLRYYPPGIILEYELRYGGDADGASGCVIRKWMRCN
jgi:hypothetical protein